MLPFLTAPNAVGQVLEEARIHQSFDGAGNFVDMAVSEREEAGATIFQMLANGVGIADVTGNAICGFGQHLIHVAALDACHHRIEAGPLHFVDASATADFIVMIGADDRPAFAVGAFVHGRQLVSRGERILKIGRETGVEDGPHESDRAFRLSCA